MGEAIVRVCLRLISGFVSCQSLLDQILDEDFKVFFCLFRYPFAGIPEFFHYVMNRMMAVKTLPYQDTHGIKPEGVTVFRVKKDGPVIELLSEHYEWICYGIFIFLHNNLPYNGHWLTALIMIVAVGCGDDVTNNNVNRGGNCGVGEGPASCARFSA
jgi:hypothetical protein